MSFRLSPRERVRFQYLSSGRLCCIRCFWMLVAMARPIDPRPIHPRRRGCCVDMLTECRKMYFEMGCKTTDLNATLIPKVR